MSEMRWARYLEQLPGGMDAYPDCTVKGAVVRNFLDYFDVSGMLHRLPAQLRPLVSSPPPAASYVSETQTCALYLAVGDLLELDDDAMLERFRDLNRVLLSGPLARMLFAFVGPDTLVRYANSRWAAFHRGSSFEVVEQEPGRVRAFLRAPLGVYDDLLTRLHVIALEVALEACGGKDVRVRILEQRDGVAQIEGTWITP